MLPGYKARDFVPMVTITLTKVFLVAEKTSYTALPVCILSTWISVDHINEPDFKDYQVKS